MENDINNKKDNSFMNRILISMFLIIGLLTTGFSIDQNEILRWEFEEGAGNIVFDLTGNQFNGLMTGARYDNLPVKWGTYSADFDGTNDYVIALNNRNTIH